MATSPPQADTFSSPVIKILQDGDPETLPVSGQMKKVTDLCLCHIQPTIPLLNYAKANFRVTRSTLVDWIL